MKSRSLFVVVVAMLAALILAGRGSATFPGKNGRIAFLKAPTSDIFTVNPDGSDMKQLTSFGSGSVGVGYLGGWSPDGRQLVFQLFDSSTSQGQLWLVNADGSNPHVLLSEPSFVEYAPSFSPDGSQVVFARCPIPQFNCGISRVQADGSGLTALVGVDPNPDVADFHAVYSPDGRTIAFTSLTRDGVLSAIYLMDADGSNIHRLTPPALEASTPDWSPDGEKIVFATNLLSGFSGAGLDEEIWVINADGTEPARLTNNNNPFHGYFTGSHDFFPSWSPQGDAIAFERDAPDFSSSAIYIMNPDGTGDRMMLQGLPRRSVKLPVTRGPAKRPVKDQLRLLLTGGGFPRWGPAPN